jgi:hypothetical protein
MDELTGAKMITAATLGISCTAMTAVYFRAIRPGLVCGALTLLAVFSEPNVSLADEGGVSFWLPGQFSSLAAVPQQPGWALAIVNYYTSVSAGGNVAAAREITIGRFNPTVNVSLNANLNANAELVLVNPSYTFATPVFGGQFALGITGIVGRSSTDLNGTLTASVGPLTATRQGSISDSVTGFGDLYPMASLRWNNGVNSWMTYVTGDIPVGAYNSSNLANLGIGHGAIDAGGGYTYFNPQTGHEFSVVTGLTYNLTNSSTNYQNGVDWHLDWGASQFLSEHVHIGVVGYFYDQLSCDSGSGDNVGCFQSRAAGIGPQIGFIFPVRSMQGYLNFKGYEEFDASDRPSGWNAWVTLVLSPAEATPPTTPMKHVYTK